MMGVNDTDRIRSIALVGGGCAGWLAASALARMLQPDFCNIRLIDSAPRAGGTACQVALPSFHRLNQLLGIDENDLVQRTQATFRLGARFVDWGRIGASYFHTSGSFGAKLGSVPFHQAWLRARRSGINTNLEEYSTSTLAAQRGRFTRPVVDRHSVLSLFTYGYHFRAEPLSRYLCQYAQAHGVERVEASVVEVQRHSETGIVQSLQLDDGSCVGADLYIDCTGGGVLSQHAAGAGYVDWSQWLPCDRAIAVTYAATDEPAPCTTTTAVSGGWSWQIPLQHTVEAGHAYSSRFRSDDEAVAALLADLPACPSEEPRLIELATGRPATFWQGNCITLPGCSAEPLESTSLHLVQTAIVRLVTGFPVRRHSPPDIDEYNRATVREHDRIRDFLILHYKATTRTDSPFWEYCRTMDIPDTLRQKLELFECCARLSMLDDEHFGEDSWLCALLGQGIEPRSYDPLADLLDVNDIQGALDSMRSTIRQAVDGLPTHRQFIDAHCRAAAL